MTRPLTVVKTVFDAAKRVINQLAAIMIRTALFALLRDAQLIIGSEPSPVEKRQIRKKGEEPINPNRMCLLR